MVFMVHWVNDSMSNTDQPGKKPGEKYLKDAGKIEDVPTAGEQAEAEQVMRQTNDTRPLSYFEEKLGVTQAEVLAAIAAVGSDPEKIEEYIRRQHDEP